MVVGTTVGKSLGNPSSQEIAFSPPVPVPSPEGGGTRDGKAILGTFCPNAVPIPNAVGKVVGKVVGKTEAGTAAHKARLMADPRFAGWTAGSQS